MIVCPTVRKSAIQWHYDLCTLFYRLMWGPHIHHGYWAADEPADVAQRQLIERLADAARIRAGDAVLDVGCGMGGSSIHLARRRGARVTGLTISPFQRRWAAAAAWLQGVGSRTRFLRRDADAAEFAPASLDVVWSVECTEHLFDKPRLFSKAAGWLRPGGRVAICAWLAGDEPLSTAQRELAHGVCEGFLCPSLGTMADYVGWMEAAGLRVELAADWTAQVDRTWEICERRVRRFGLDRIAGLGGRETRRFVERFGMLLRAYRTGAMRYGCLVAELPAGGGAAHPFNPREDTEQ